MRNHSISAFGLLLLLSLSLLARPASAGSSFEFLWNSSSVDDDDEWFLHLAVNNYGYPRTVIEPVVPRLRYVEADLPVVLFLAHQSGRPVDFIVNLRSEGLGWSVIFTRVGVPYDVLFVGIDRDPGPPYGKAWGHWKKQRKHFRPSDDVICGLVNVQTAHRVTGLSSFDVARARGHGKSFASVVAEKKGRPRHDGSSGKGNGGAPGAKKGGGHGKEGKGGGKGH